MTNEYKLAYVQGFLDATLGSVRAYTVDDLRRKMEIATRVLRDEQGTPEFHELLAKDLERQAILDGERQSIV